VLLDVAGERQGLARGHGHDDLQSIPGIALIAGMPPRCPAGNVAGEPHITVVGAAWRAKVDRLPGGVVGVGIGPGGIVTGVESL
jgi:hypothetical protein